MSQQDSRKLAEDLVNTLGLQNMPLAISFTQNPCPASSRLPMTCRHPRLQDTGRGR